MIGFTIGVIVGGVAGICTGVFLREKEIVTCAHIQHGGEKLVAGVRVAVERIRKEVMDTRPEPACPSVPDNG